MKKLILFSGGPDSTSAVYILKDQYDLQLLTLVDNQRTKNICEVELASKTAKSLGLSHKIFDISHFNELFSDLPFTLVGLGGGNKPGKREPSMSKIKCVPDGKYEAPLSIQFLHTIGAMYAISHGYSSMIWAVHKDDDIISEQWIKNYTESLSESFRHSGFDFCIETPFIHLTKAELIIQGIKNGMDIETTYSCLVNTDFTHCGQCEGCREREKALSFIKTNEVLEEETLVTTR